MELALKLMSYIKMQAVSSDVAYSIVLNFLNLLSYYFFCFISQYQGGILPPFSP